MPNVKCAESAPPAPYAGFAQYYDLLGWSEFSELVFPIITAFFEKINHTPASFLDLACGTGTLAHLLAAQKIKVLGLDICPEMIAIAQAKTCPDGYLPEFRQADITSFKLDRKFEMAGCFFDSVNHLPSNNAVKDSFRCVADHLASGGWYLFDLVTRRGLENWKDYYNSQEDTFYIAQEARFLPDQNCARVKI